MKRKEFTLGKNFVLCGLAGWCIEVAFTSAGSIFKKDKKLTGQTSAWMFPIYGLAAVIGEIAPKIAHWPTPLRALFYGGSIMTTEYITGSIERSPCIVIAIEFHSYSEHRKAA